VSRKGACPATLPVYENGDYTQNPQRLSDFPGHQIRKFDLYFPHSIRPPLVIQFFLASCLQQAV
jgi:hypothetical protein